MSISASQVKELREMSGVGMMECKKALVETNGDLQQALDLLRANSSLKAEKKASRVAADGAHRARAPGRDRGMAGVGTAPRAGERAASASWRWAAVC